MKRTHAVFPLYGSHRHRFCLSEIRVPLGGTHRNYYYYYGWLPTARTLNCKPHTVIARSLSVAARALGETGESANEHLLISNGRAHLTPSLPRVSSLPSLNPSAEDG